MRNIKQILLCLFASVMMVSCLKDDDSEDYAVWKAENEAFFKRMQDSIDPATGELYYRKIESLAYPQYYVLVHELEAGPAENTTKPLFTSTVTVDYEGHLYNTTEEFAEGNVTFIVGRGTSTYPVSTGWTWALMDMTVGDKWEVVIPWELAYGSSGNGTIPPYSTLIFDMKLVSIPMYETGYN